MSFEALISQKEKVDIRDIIKKAKEVLEEGAIKFEDFKGIKKTEEILEDKKRLSRVRSEIEKRLLKNPELREIKEKAILLEALIYTQGESANWFGENAFTIKTSEFDDIINGIDLVVEFVKEDEKTEKPDVSRLALAVDVTTSESFLREKLKKIKAEIIEGSLGRIKYFISENTGKESLIGLPKTIVGTSMLRTAKTAELWSKQKNNILAFHPMQFLILEEIVLQLDTFIDFCKNSGRKLEDRIVFYEKAKREVREILSKKKENFLSELIKMKFDNKQKEEVLDLLQDYGIIDSDQKDYCLAKIWHPEEEVDKEKLKLKYSPKEIIEKDDVGKNLLKILENFDSLQYY